MTRVKILGTACAGEIATELEKGDTPCGRQTS